MFGLSKCSVPLQLFKVRGIKKLIDCGKSAMITKFLVHYGPQLILEENRYLQNFIKAVMVRARRRIMVAKVVARKKLDSTEIEEPLTARTCSTGDAV